MSLDRIGALADALEIMQSSVGALVSPDDLRRITAELREVHQTHLGAVSARHAAEQEQAKRREAEEKRRLEEERAEERRKEREAMQAQEEALRKRMEGLMN